MNKSKNTKTNTDKGTNSLLSFIFSMTTTGILLAIFAIAIGYATFVENDFGTITAKIMIYNARWFEVLLLLLVINLAGSIIENKLISRKRWSGFLFHVSFIIIFIGAGVTRYTGTEGNMHIREGSSSDEIISEETYININASDETNSISLVKQVRFAETTTNKFKEELSINDKSVVIENIQFIPSATKTIIDDPLGKPVISIVAMEKDNKQLEFILKKGEDKRLNNLVISFDKQTDETCVLIKEKNDSLTITALNGSFSAGEFGSEFINLPHGEEFQIGSTTIYQIDYIKFILNQYTPKGKIEMVYDPENTQSEISDAVRLKVSVGDKSEIVDVLGNKGLTGQPSSIIIDDINIILTYGSELKKLPFELFLNDFQIERYPGSNSPSSFASEVTLIDKTSNIERPFRIFMNNILKYKGYRFFQSSYDQDEKGTILSVNYDSRGTAITYIGYLLMLLGMIFTLFNKNSRFKTLVRALAKLKAQRTAFLIATILTGSTFLSIAQDTVTEVKIDRDHAVAFGELLIQSNDGRIEPINSVASKVLRKVYKNDSFENMSAIQVFLDLNADPGKWASKKIIKISSKEIKLILGITEDYAAFNDIVSQGSYKLSHLVDQAYGKEAGARTKLDKEVMKIDERVNICYLCLSGEMMKIFPIPGDDNHTWIYLQGSEQKLPQENKEFAIRVYSNYLAEVNNAKVSGNWDLANNLLKELKDNQLKHSSEVIPGISKIRFENFYINFNIFKKLALFYLFLGLILLFSAFVNIFKPEINLRTIFKVGFILVFVLFFLHTAGLGIRWYIAGHAPWSNGYESMVFISWATCLSGLIFAKRSQMSLAVTTVLSALTLLIAGLSWMSPEITNLVPVLKSYWLIVHVAIVTASYGFLAIGSLLGLTNLILIILRNDKNKVNVTSTIKELVYIIEIALIIGVFLLTVGSFLGGVWANESWGRYWGWDPKETWAMVTILVYSFIVHMHRIPGLKGNFQMSTAALVGFASVLMTYFGVNYYLSGLHSYASGDSIPIPSGLYIGIFVLLIIIISAFLSNRVFSKHTGQEELNEVE